MTIKLFIITIYAFISIVPMYAMENVLTIFSQKTDYQSLSNNDIVQLKIPKEPLDKICAYCSHYTRCALQVTCKQFLHSASLNNFDQLIIHNVFTIGNDEEKQAFFKALIKTNNPKFISPCINHAKKEAKDYYMRNVIYEFDPVHHTEQEYLQKRYLTPLLKEAISQNNSTMIDRLAEEDIDQKMIEKYYGDKYTCWLCLSCSPCICLLCIICCPCLCLLGGGGGGGSSEYSNH